MLYVCIHLIRSSSGNILGPLVVVFWQIAQKDLKCIRPLATYFLMLPAWLRISLFAFAALVFQMCFVNKPKKCWFITFFFFAGDVFDYTGQRLEVTEVSWTGEVNTSTIRSESGCLAFVLPPTCDWLMWSHHQSNKDSSTNVFILHIYICFRLR